MRLLGYPLGAVALACALVPAAAAAAAPTYTVHSCRGPAGEPLATGAFERAFRGEQVLLSDSCSSGGSLHAELASVPDRPQGDSGSYSFFAPAGTTIAGYRAWLSSSVGKGDYQAGRIEDAFQPDQTAALCEGSLGCTGEGDANDPLSDKNLVTQLGTDRDVLTLIAACAGKCPQTAGPPVIVELYRSQVDLADPTPPVLTEPPAGPLLDATSPRSGVLDARFSATDSGGGLRDAILEIDGAEVVRQPAGDPCVEPFTEPLPCPLGATGTVTFDTRQLDDGQHTLVLAVTDATGVNEARSEPVAITTANPDPTPEPTATPTATPTPQPTATPTPTPVAPAAAALAGPPRPVPAVLTFTDPRPRRARYDEALTASGTLRTATGAPVPFARIRVTARPRITGATAAERPTLVTDAAGKFALRLRARNSQTLALSAGAAHARLEVRVASRVIARASRRRARNGDTLRVDGRVARPAFQQEAGKVVEIQVSGADGWRTIDAVVATRGRFRWTYQFRATTRRTTYRFRALVQAEDGWPFEDGTSDPIAVRVRP